MNADWKYAETKQSLFYAAMVKQLGFESLLLLASDGGSYPFCRPKAQNLRSQHFRRFVMWSLLPRQDYFELIPSPSNNFQPFRGLLGYAP